VLLFVYQVKDGQLHCWQVTSIRSGWKIFSMMEWNSQRPYWSFRIMAGGLETVT
jgi:hypothetical protein